MAIVDDIMLTYENVTSLKGWKPNHDYQNNVSKQRQNHRMEIEQVEQIANVRNENKANLTNNISILFPLHLVYRRIDEDLFEWNLGRWCQVFLL